MKKHIVCLGDSNTHGYCADSTDCEGGGIRFSENQRWTRLLQKHLGEDYLVIEEGLSGRTTCFDDPIHEGLNALNYIYPCLKSHEDVDLLVIMLGTNDTKDRFYASAACIALGMARLVNKAKATACWGGKEPNILVVCPPPIGEGMLTSPVAATMGTGCVIKSRELAVCPCGRPLPGCRCYGLRIQYHRLHAPDQPRPCHSGRKSGQGHSAAAEIKKAPGTPAPF